MSINTNASGNNEKVTIAISGRFDFSVHGEFRESYKKFDPGVSEYVLDMKQTDYVDSSALGMMLLLKEHADGSSASVSLINVTSDIKEILEIANFDKIFNIQ